MRVQEEQKRLSREARKRNEEIRIEAQKRKKRKRVALQDKSGRATHKTSKVQRYISQVPYTAK